MRFCVNFDQSLETVIEKSASKLNAFYFGYSGLNPKNYSKLYTITIELEESNYAEIMLSTCTDYVVSFF